MRTTLPALAALLLLAGCETGYPSPPRPADARDAPARTVGAISGQVFDETGDPIPNAVVRVVAYDPEQGAAGGSVACDAIGLFSLSGASDRNWLLHISAAGYYAACVPVDLERDAGGPRDLGPITLVAKQADRVRLILAGDTMFGRRFADADEDGLEGEAGDLIRPGSRAADTIAILRFLPELLADGDYRVVNFESPLSTQHDFRHPYKTYSFTSHPATLAGLSSLGIDAVSLGNNHCFDYLQPDMADTLNALDAAGQAWFGAGLSATQARASVHQASRNGVTLSFQGFNGIPPNDFPEGTPDPWPPEYLYNALDTPVVKGGALTLDDDELTGFLAAHRDSSLAIPVLHGGWEYGEQPSTNMLDRFALAVAEGAVVVKAHHPHNLYGLALGDHPVSGEPSVVFMSLGNFCFDQEVFETFNSAIAVVDVDRLADDSYRVHRVEMRAFHQEDYIPSATCGPLAERSARHLGHLSTFMDTSAGLRGAVVFPEAEGTAVCIRNEDYLTADLNDLQSATTINGIALARIDGARAASSVSRLGALPPGGARLGRDLLIYGDMEDGDIDGAAWELPRWTLSSVHYPTQTKARSGRCSLLLHRTDRSDQTAVSVLRNRISFTPTASLTLHGWFWRENAGAITVTVDYIQRDTRNELGTSTLFALPAGSDIGWQPFAVDLTPPGIAGHLRLSLHMDPPASGEATACFDDFALIDWQRTVGEDEAVPTPNDFTWLRLEQPATVQVGLRRYQRDRGLAAVTRR